MASDHTAAESHGAAATLADDLLRGAAAIAGFIYGDEKKRRQVYSAAERGEIPVFRDGAIICARRSAILKHYEAKEAASLRLVSS